MHALMQLDGREMLIKINKMILIKSCSTKKKKKHSLIIILSCNSTIYRGLLMGSN